MALQDDWLESYRGATRFSEEMPHRTCTTMAHNQLMMEAYPAFRRLLSELESETRARLAEPQAFAADEPVTIPVVIHVVWRTDAENISDAQIASQMDVLNADYAATNPDRASIPSVWQGLSIDSGVQFRLTSIGPDGAPHSGINRVQTNVSGFSTDDGVKSAATGGADAWPAEIYLNLWVCNLGGGVLGYAQFPGGPPSTDGVVIGYRYFGVGGSAVQPFDRGRTATHEVGHWLNLRHIWGDTEDCTGSDFVADTPGQRLPNYNEPSFPSISCNNGPNGDMFMNYMDYVDDVAMFMFTSGQVARMRATLSSIRAGLMASQGSG
jgi:hypothetical protein